MDAEPRRPYLVRDIVNWLRENYADITITEEDLKSPISENVCVIYQRLLEMVLGFSLEDKVVQLPPSLTLANIDEIGSYPELWQATQPKMMLFLITQRVMPDISAQSHDYEPTLQEFLAPTTKGTVKLMTTFIEFIETKKKAHQPIKKVLEEREDEKAERQELQQLILEMQEKIQQKRVCKVMKGRNVAALREQHNQMRNRLAELGQQAEQTRTEFALLSNQCKSEQSAADSMNTELKHMQHERQKVLSEVVTSPEKVTRELAELQATKDQLTKKVEELRLKIASLSDRQKNFEETEQQIKSLENPLMEAENKRKLLEEQQKLMKNVREEIDEARRHLKALQGKSRYAREELDAQRAQFSKLDHNHQLKMDKLKKTQKHLQTKIHDAKQLAEQNEVVSSDIVQRCADTETEIRTLATTFVDQNALLNAEFSELIKTVDDGEINLKHCYQIFSLQNQGESDSDDE